MQAEKSVKISLKITVYHDNSYWSRSNKLNNLDVIEITGGCVQYVYDIADYHFRFSFINWVLREYTMRIVTAMVSNNV